MSISKEDLALASYVALRLDDWTPEQGCPAWVESRSTTCKRDLFMNTALCLRHRGVASKRHEKRRAELLKQQAERIEYRAKMLPEWEAELAKVEADMERYGGAPTTDRAAYGGEVHPSIQRAQLRQLSDTNVQRMARLSRRAEELRRKIQG